MNVGCLFVGVMHESRGGVRRVARGEGGRESTNVGEARRSAAERGGFDCWISMCFSVVEKRGGGLGQRSG